MDVLHVETKYRGEVSLPDELVDKLPQRIIICGIIQYLDILPQIEEQLQKAGKHVERYKSIHGSKRGQVLGCDVFKFPGEFDCFLFVGDGLFHPTALLYENDKEVFLYNPLENSWKIITRQVMENVKKKRRIAFAKFLHADKVGILLTTKPGQAPIQSRKIRTIEEMYPDKEFFYFVADTLNISELENYPFIQSWVNTACPRILEDDAMMANLRDILVAAKKQS